MIPGVDRVCRAVGFGLGILLLVLVLQELNAATILQSLRQVSWLGFAVVVITGLGLTACLSSGLYPLLLDAASLRLFAARQVQDSCGDILPFTRSRHRPGHAGSVAGRHRAGPCLGSRGGGCDDRADGTGLFILTGLGLAAPAIRADQVGPIFRLAGDRSAVVCSQGDGFVFLQLAGSRIAEKVLAVPKLGRATAFREALHHLYCQRTRVAWRSGCTWAGAPAGSAVGGVPGAGKTDRACLRHGHSGFAGGAGSVTVFIPAAVGVQEVGYAALGALFGFAPKRGCRFATTPGAGYRGRCSGSSRLAGRQARRLAARRT